MPTSYDLTGDLGDLLAAPSIAATAKAWLETNIEGPDALVDTTGQTVRLGGTLVSIAPDGTFSATGLAGSDSTDLNVEAGTLQYQLVVEYRDAGTSGNYKRVWRSGWFFLNQTEDIATVAKSVTPAVAATGADIIAAASDEADRAEAAAAAAVAPTDTQVATLAQDPLSETGQALSATYARRLRPVDEYPAGTRVERHPAPRTILGLDSTRGEYLYYGSGIYQVQDSNPFGVSQSKGVPAGVNSGAMGRTNAVLHDDGYWYLSCLTSGGVPALYRAQAVANPTTFSWSASLKSMKAGANILPSNLVSGGGYLFWGEYGSPTGGPEVYRSADGVTWESVLGPIATTHCHGIGVDPHNPTHVYVTFGDTANIRHYRSTQSGAPGTFEQIGSQLSTWQAVQISFTEEYVYYASDANAGGWTAWRMHKTTLEREWLSPEWHFMRPVPGGVGGRRVSDLVITNGSSTLTSATANFTSADVGAIIRSTATNMPDNCVIRTVNSATSVTVNQSFLGASGTYPATITGDLFYSACFYGAVDPTTGIYYCVANDRSFAGNTAGLFAILPGGQMHLLKVLQSAPDTLVVLADGKGWYGEYQWSLLT